MEIDIKKIIGALGGTKNITVTVAGDFCLDKYLYSDPAMDEVSAETGLPCYMVHRKETFAGVGGTITNNLRSLGVNVYAAGVAGEDGEGFELLRELDKTGVETKFIVRTDKMCTGTYTKPMRLGADGKYKESNRIDFRNFFETPKEIEDKLIENIKKAVGLSDAVIVTDQFPRLNCSAVTERVRDAVSKLAAANLDIIFYADSRCFADRYRNVIVKCNHREIVKTMAPELGEDIAGGAVFSCGKKLNGLTGRTVIVSEGDRGLNIFDNGHYRVPSFNVDGEIDITGAGDATNAGLVTGLALGLNMAEAGTLGCCVASITIKQIGVTGTATVGQVREVLEKREKTD